MFPHVLREDLVTPGESKKGWSGIVGVAAVFHEEAAHFARSSRLFYRGGAVPAGREGAAVMLDSLAWRLRPAPGAATSPQAIGPVATRRAPMLQHTAQGQSAILPAPTCGTAALCLSLEPWAWMRSVGSGCALGMQQG